MILLFYTSDFSGDIPVFVILFLFLELTPLVMSFGNFGDYFKLNDKGLLRFVIFK